MKVLVVFHSTYGYTHALAKAIAEGVTEVPGVELVLRRAPEFATTVQHMEQEKGYSYQVYQGLQSIPECTLDDLKAADGVLFGSPTRYGNMDAQMKALIDCTAQLWLSGAMEGKPAGVFTSTASTHGGQETTLLTMIVPLLHLGMAVRKAFRSRFPKVGNCSRQDIEHVKRWLYTDADIVVEKAFSSHRNWFIVEANLRGSECDGLSDEAFASPWFVITPQRQVRFLNSGMWLVDAGDYDADGKSEIVFSLDDYNRGGYKLFYDDFRRSATFEFTYH
jgi:NAD(P)H dehydrogenase (quinone)